MQTSQNALHGHTLIILDEYHIETSFSHIPLIIGFHKISSAITMNCGLNYFHPFDKRIRYFNLSHLILLQFL